MAADIFLAPLGYFLFQVRLILVGLVFIIKVLLDHLGLFIAFFAVVLVEL